MLKCVPALLLVAVAISAKAGPINLITNGSFELGTNGAAPGSWTMEDVGSTNIQGWSVTQNNVD